MVTVTKVMTNRGKRRARPGAPPVAMTSPVEEVDGPSGPRGKKGTSGHRSEGIFPYHNFETYGYGVLVG